MSTALVLKDLWAPLCYSVTTEDLFCVKSIQVSLLIIAEFTLPDLSKLIGQEWKGLNEAA